MHVHLFKIDQTTGNHICECGAVFEDLIKEYL